MIEITTSRNLQPLKLLYRHNVVTGSEVLIFYNSQAYAEHYRATGYDKQKFDSDQAAVKLFELLNFDKVTTYICLSKCQIIEKLDLL